MKKTIVSGLLLSLLILSACGNEPNEEKTTTQGTATLRTEQTSNVSIDSETISSKEISTEQTSQVSSKQDGVIKRAEYTASFSEDWNGLISSINKVVIVEITDEEAEEYMFDSNYIVQVYFEIQNSSDTDYNTYPDQSVLVIEGQQVDADMFVSDSLGGEILSGVTKDGVVTFVVPQINDVENVTDIRLKWSADFDTDNYEIESYKEFDATFDLIK